MPQYYFDVWSPEWDYRDPDGIKLADDDAATAYAERIIRELKADEGYDASDLQMLVKDKSQHVMFAIPFNSTNVKLLGKSHSVMPIGIR